MVTRTIVAYGFAVDTGDGVGTAALFTDDAVFDVDRDSYCEDAPTSSPCCSSVVADRPAHQPGAPEPRGTAEPGPGVPVR